MAGKKTASKTVGATAGNGQQKGPKLALYRDPKSGATWSGCGRADVDFECQGPQSIFNWWQCCSWHEASGQEGCCQEGPDGEENCCQEGRNGQESGGEDGAGQEGDSGRSGDEVGL